MGVTGEMNSRNLFLSKWVFISLLFVVCACSNQEQNTKTVAKPLEFQDSSQGLPESARWRHRLAFHDLNGDGYLDILAPPPRLANVEESHPFVWFGSKENTWKNGDLKVPQDVGFGYGSIAVADFNMDGYLDLALAMHFLPSSVLLGTANGSYDQFSEGLPSEKKFLSRALTISDINNDGKMELLIVSEAGFGRKEYEKGIRVCYLNGNKWQCEKLEKNREDAGVFSDQIITGDINGDGHKDVAVALLSTEKNRLVWLGDGKGGFEPFNEGLPKDRVYYSVALGDINHDGKEDMVASISDFDVNGLYGPRVFLSGDEKFTEFSEGLPNKESVSALTLGDLDGNGSLEIICGARGGVIKVYGEKDGKWFEMPVVGFPEESAVKIYGIYALDVNRDKKTDIVFNYAPVGQKGKGGIRVFLNRGENGPEKGQ